MLWCACATANPSDCEAVRALAKTGLNWPDVVAYAARHHLSPVVYEVIASAAQDLISPEQLSLLRRPAESSAAWGMALLQELLRLRPFFEAARIPVIPYKGPVLASIAYGSFVRREYSDLDFAVQQKFIPDIVAVMNAAGYAPQFDPREAHPGQNGFAPGQYSFFLASQKLLVEFHTERTLRYFPRPLDFQDLMGRLMEIEVCGRRLRTFSIEDTLVMLCVHGAKHFWERIAWVLDIAKVAALPGVDWTLVRKIAAKRESARALRLGLFLAHDVLAASLPERLHKQILQDRALPTLAAKVCQSYAGISGPAGGIFSRAVFRVRTRDSVRQGVRHLVRLTVSPTESDRQIMQLPRWLAPFYSLTRPWRLLREYGLGLRRR